MNKRTIITTLAIDTSCDETSASVVRNTTVLSNVQPSQMEYHQKYGGVVPNLARLAHQERIDNVVIEAMKRAHVEWNDIDLIAVTYGPGLAIALEIGVRKAKELAIEHKKPLMKINHMEGHLLSAYAKRNTKQSLPDLDESVFTNVPKLGVLVSGGHTELVLVHAIGNYEKIGETLDDSCGECLDKCGRMIGLGYPAGPVISQFAKEQRKSVSVNFVNHNQSRLAVVSDTKNKKQYQLPIPMAFSNDLHMSYSGLKTAFRQVVQSLSDNTSSVAEEVAGVSPSLSKQEIFNLCVLIEAAAYEQIASKLKKAIDIYQPQEILLGGGVVASARLRQVIRIAVGKIPVRVPFSKKLTTDNAAMIGVAANINVIQLHTLHKIVLSPEHTDTLKDHGIFFRAEDIAQIDRDPSVDL